MKKPLLDTYSPYIFLAVMMLAAVVFRPALPVDETRYLTVAWEMFLNKNYSLLTMNFEPYHHKPPMLFWLINLSWNAFGISRAAALLPVFWASCLFVFLAGKLSRRLFEDRSELVPWVMLGTLPFLIYSTLLMFDILIGAFVLATLIFMLDFASTGRKSNILWAGVFTGLAILVKGPVGYLYILWPLMLYPLWRRDGHVSARGFYLAILSLVILSVGPVLLWLLPTVQQADGNFAYWLIWEQTAGRISGNFNAAHVRPFYFYLMLSPLLFMPWIFIPDLWRRARSVLHRGDKGLVFLACWFVPVFLTFSLIAGKQPHYLVPLVPAIVIFVSRLLQDSDRRLVKGIAGALLLLFFAGHAIASRTFFETYRMDEIADFLQANPDHDYAYVRNYQGELGFLARRERPLENLAKEDLAAWFADHPDGYAVIRYKDGEDMSGYHALYSSPYRGKNLGVFEKAQ